MSDCLFCKFAGGEIPVNKVFENEDFIIIRDIEPKAKNHFLAIPKKHFKYLAEMTEEDSAMLGRILATIPTLSDILELDGGYGLVSKLGVVGGECVPDVHMLFLAGQSLLWEPWWTV